MSIINEKRASTRRRAYIGADIISGANEGDANCVIRDMSPTGARLRLSVTAPSLFDLQNQAGRSYPPGSQNMAKRRGLRRRPQERRGCRQGDARDNGAAPLLALSGGRLKLAASTVEK